MLCRHVGRIVPEKGLDILFRSISQLLKEGINIELLIIGSGTEDYVNKLKNTLNNVGVINNVFFAGPVNSDYLPLVYSKADILVLPTLTTDRCKEQFGRVLIEAMACETAVVGSSSGEIPNVIGDAGLVFKEGDSDDLFLKLKELILNGDLRKKLAKKGKARVDELYSWTAVSKQLKQYYLEVLSK